MKVKIKMLYPDAIPPKYAHSGDACADVYSFSVTADQNDNIVIDESIYSNECFFYD